MFAPIPPVPVPRVPYALSPEQSNRLEELTRYMEAAALLSNDVEKTGEHLPAKRKDANPDSDHHRASPKKARIVAGQRVRSPRQRSKRRIQNTQNVSTRRRDARARLESNRARLAEDAAALAEQRLKELDDKFAELVQQEEQFPPELPDVKTLYTNFYNEMTDLATNLVCASCGCIDHRIGKFEKYSIVDASLRHLHVDPSIVPFSFSSGISELDDQNIMIDPAGIVQGPPGDITSLLVCRSCQRSLANGVRPPESLANYRWIGAVPPQLQGLTWIEELLIARSHLAGRIVRLQNRNATSYFSLKGHVILLPQAPTKLLDILPLPPSSLPDIVRVVWVGRPVRNFDVLRDHFSVRTGKVYDALVWLIQNNEDYKDVTIDQSLFERWPPVWVADNLLNLAGGLPLENGSDEENTRMGIATEDVDTPEINGDLPFTASGIVDVNGVSQPSQLNSIQQISLWKSDKVINVVTGNKILNESNLPSYFTSAFPTLFPWGTGKHIDDRRLQDPKTRLDLKKWIQLLLRNSSRYHILAPRSALTCIRRFQGHSGFVVLCYDLLRRGHSLRKSNLITSRDTWVTTGPLLRSLTDERLETAARQAAQHKPITDSAVTKLLAMVNTIGSTDPGSIERKSHLLTRLKAATVYFGLPQIFITLNPADTISPLALFYAGERIDVKAFHPRLYTAGERLKTMLDNPLAVVDYFRNTIDTIIETMLKGGMFGELIHYHGPIEYQGRGTPHAHLVLWIKGGGSPQSLREKAKDNPTFRDRLLNYIEHVCIQCMPEEVIDEGNPEPGGRAFQPNLPPDHPSFEEAMMMDVFDIVLSRQMHSEHHNPTCFKYGSRMKCRFRFPRKLVPLTVLDGATGVILQQRDHQWLNNYNPWFSLAMRTNHDCQYLFTQIHALAIIYYTMKYISKVEENTHSKLTIAAAVARALATSKPDGRDEGKSMLIKTYNKLSSHREVGIPEAISHLLDYPEALSSGTFQSIRTTHLLNHLKALNSGQDDLTLTDMGDSSILRVQNSVVLLSLFDDYAHRGLSLANMCLYDYVSLVYKSTNQGGIPFDSAHPQHTTNRQFIRKETAAIPTPLGKLFFLRPDSDDESVRNEYFCLVSGLFIPWTHDQPPVKASTDSWEKFFSVKKEFLSPRLLRHIDNLALLHKSKVEAQIDQLQLFAQYGQEAENGNGDRMFGEPLETAGDENWEEERDEMTRSLALVQSSLEASLDSLDDYVREAMEANFMNGYFEDSLGSPMSPSDTTGFDFHEPTGSPTVFEVVDPKVIRKLLKDVQLEDEHTIRRSQHDDIQPNMFLTESESDIASVIRDFSLNTEQSRALRIVCNHALGNHPPQEPQLLMAVLGAGGTGKSTLIDAIRTWFRRNGRDKELIVTATTGSAAVKINGSTVHSAASIPIETSDGKRMGKLKKHQLNAWEHRQYMIIDEVSMLDSEVIAHLHSQLGRVKANPEINFGGVNIIFFGDFLQLPAVLNPDVYVNNNGLGHRLWRSLNGVVILTQQMRQARDPPYAALLSRCRMHKPTDDDIEKLRDRIGAKLPNMQSAAVTVRRHTLRQAINMRRLREEESKSDARIMYCVGDVNKLYNMSLHAAYQIQFGERGSPVDAILPLLPGVPLMVTKNMNQTLDLVNGKIVNFVGFADFEGNRPNGQIITPPAYMLVKVPGKQFRLGPFPVGVFPLELSTLTFEVRRKRQLIRSATFRQFPVTLAYAITDYKSQGETYSNGLLTDLCKPLTGSTPAASLYVQLSRVQTIQQLSIMRDFDPEELRKPLSHDLMEELEWEQEMDARTREKYNYLE